MRITGLAFIGTWTEARPEMARFVRDVLGLPPTTVEGITGDVFELPDGSTLVVSDVGTGEIPQRTIGLLVDDVDEAVAELRAAAVETDDEISTNDRYRYVHFRAPDGQLYELIEPTE